MADVEDRYILDTQRAEENLRRTTREAKDFERSLQDVERSSRRTERSLFDLGRIGERFRGAVGGVGGGGGGGLPPPGLFFGLRATGAIGGGGGAAAAAGGGGGVAAAGGGGAAAVGGAAIVAGIAAAAVVAIIAAIIAGIIAAIVILDRQFQAKLKTVAFRRQEPRLVQFLETRQRQIDEQIDTSLLAAADPTGIAPGLLKQFTFKRAQVEAALLGPEGQRFVLAEEKRAEIAGRIEARQEAGAIELLARQPRALRPAPETGRQLERIEAFEGFLDFFLRLGLPVAGGEGIRIQQIDSLEVKKLTSDERGGPSAIGY